MQVFGIVKKPHLLMESPAGWSPGPSSSEGCMGNAHTASGSRSVSANDSGASTRPHSPAPPPPQLRLSELDPGHVCQKV